MDLSEHCTQYNAGGQKVPVKKYFIISFHK